MAEITVQRSIPSWASIQSVKQWDSATQQELDIPFIVIDPQTAYPLVLALLGQHPDQYWLEVARRCLTAALLDMVGPGINVKILNRPEWALAKYPEGDGEARGGAEFRRHYEPIKGGLLK